MTTSREAQLEQAIARLTLPQLADVMSARGGAEFYCPFCQAHDGARILNGPRAVLRDNSDRCARIGATWWSCTGCGVRGTWWTLARLLLENVEFVREAIGTGGLVVAGGGAA